MGPQCPEMMTFVAEQQEIAREEHRTQREEAREDARAQAAREQEIEMLKLRGNRQ